MSTSSAPPVARPLVLGEQGEREWRRLRRQLELVEGFWLGFIFVQSPPVADVLRERMEVALRSRARRMSMIRPVSPEQLGSALPELLALAAGGADCIWIEAIRLDPPAEVAKAGSWEGGWRKLIVLMNERRERLRRDVHGGLVLVAPRELKPIIREMASDLWSIRSIVLELEPRPRARQPGRETGQVIEMPLLPSSGRIFPPTVTLVLRDRPEVAELLREVEGLLLTDRPGDAVVAARKAVEMLQQQDNSSEVRSDLAAALAALARSAAAAGESEVALPAIQQAVEIYKAKGANRVLLSWFDLWQTLAIKEGCDGNQAQQAAEGGVAVARELSARDPENPQALRDLVACLEKLGHAHHTVGDLDAAIRAYDEGLQIARRLLETRIEDPQVLRDFSMSLRQLGHVHREAGNFEHAQHAYEESLALDRRLLGIVGELPQTLGDLEMSLRHVAEIREQLGDDAGATAAREERAAIAAELADFESPQEG